MSLWPFVVLQKDKLSRWFSLLAEERRYASVNPIVIEHFWVVTCSWNAGPSALKCIDSVYGQNYDRGRLTHVFIDDHSTDETSDLIAGWMESHPDNNLIYIRNDEQVGGTQNTLEAFRSAPKGTIVVELNGDDWLPGYDVIPFLNKVYADEDVWMTYNSYRYADQKKNRETPVMLHPIPKNVMENNGIREYIWMTRHLHTFRRELFDHIDDQIFIDPATGEFWKSSDDQAIYLSMFELAGEHARHIFRDMYIYNHRSLSDDVVDLSGSRERMKRIRQMKKYQALESL